MIKGELKGDQLDKYNAETLQEWNTAALTQCNHCKRSGVEKFLATEGGFNR